MNESLLVWAAFNLFVFAMIFLDLFLYRGVQQVKISQSIIMSALWISLALIFDYGIYLYLGKEDALNFLTGYVIEKALSVDNLFVFILIFKYFQTPKIYQHKVLFWGILGAIALRALFIFFGIELVKSFGWILYLFGAFLVYAGVKMAFSKSEQIDPEKNLLLGLLKKWIPITHQYHGNRFFVFIAENWHATPLFLVLLAIESTDLIFAIDSIPAVMAITRDPFIIYTSNIFAILGLRSLYFALSGIITLFHFLNYALAAILIFVGIKMLIEPYIAIPIGIALSFIILALAFGVVASLLVSKKSN